MKSLNKFISALFIICFAAVSSIASIPTDNISAASYKISVKLKQTPSNQINVVVTYSGASKANKDWIGIYKKDTKPSEKASNAALAWAYVSGSSGTVTFTQNNFVSSEYSPQKGSILEDGIYKAVICKSDSYIVAASYEFTIGVGNPNFNFDVFSDSHIGSKSYDGAANLNNALNDIKTFAPNSNALVSNGDSVDQADWTNYTTLRDVYFKQKSGLPPVYFNLGNHELFDTVNPSNYFKTDFNTKFYNRFLYFSRDIHHNLTGTTLASDNRSVPYYEEKVNNYHFIFLASESMNYKDKMDISSTQLQWLDNKLWHIANDEPHQPVFVFGHGALLNTVAGSYSSQKWNGVSDNADSKLRFVLNKYPNVIYISAHSHWQLTSKNTMFEDKATYGNGVGATFINNGGLSNLYCDQNCGVSGSQGLHILVYKDNKVVIKGRDYSKKQWVARYTIDLKKHYQSLDTIY